MKLHAKDDDNEYLHPANIKSYEYDNEKKKKKSLRKTLDLQLLKQ